MSQTESEILRFLRFRGIRERALLDTDRSAVVREEIVDTLEGVADERVDPALERRVLVDPDVDIAVASLELRRARAMGPLLRLLEERLETERKSGHSAAIGRLVREQERWTSVVRGALLPTFFQLPPPVFAVRPAGRPVRVLAFGDFGDGSDAQRLVAAAMMRYHRRRPFDFGVTLGDNFYPSGMESPADPRWRTEWSALYDPLKIPFYATLGNHDYNQPNSPAAEILFTRQSGSWRMPAAYYTFTAGPVQFFALDTDILSEAQLLWLASELESQPRRVAGRLRPPSHLLGGPARRQQRQDRSVAAGAQGSRGCVPRRTRPRHAAPQA